MAGGHVSPKASESKSVISPIPPRASVYGSGAWADLLFEYFSLLGAPSFFIIAAGTFLSPQ
jgi:hypothetical protein